MEATSIKLAEVRTDGGTQMRAEISEERTQEYAEALQDGAEFPPIVVFFDGNDYWLADGFHRVGAFTHARKTEIPGLVFDGSLKDAIRYALSANAKNGQRRTRDDLRRCYEAAVAHGFCEAHDAAGVQAFLRCATSHAYAMTKQAREALKADKRQRAAELAAEGKTQREIAADVGVPRQTVTDWLGRNLRSGKTGQDTPSPPAAAHANKEPAPMSKHKPKPDIANTIPAQATALVVRARIMAEMNYIIKADPRALDVLTEIRDRAQSMIDNFTGDSNG